MNKFVIIKALYLLYPNLVNLVQTISYKIYNIFCKGVRGWIIVCITHHLVVERSYIKLYAYISFATYCQ